MNTLTTSRRLPPLRAFTLVELLVVIVIISLLVAILAPSVSRAIQMSYLARTRSQIQNLERGLESFKYENKFYPGQTAKTNSDMNVIGSGGLGDYDKKGSHFLARMLWTTDPFATTWVTTGATPNGYPKTTDYSAYDSTMLIANHATSAYNDAISDGFSKPMPILYFAANLNYDDDQQFRKTPALDMNNGYLTTSGNDKNANGSLIHMLDYPKIKDKFDLWPRLKDRYILLAPGLNRQYFSVPDPSDASNTAKFTSDDVTN